MKFAELLHEIIRLARQGGFPCLFHILTGAYCPGCGGTRAAFALLYGHPLLSLLYHPLVPYMAVSLPFLLLWYVRCRKRKKPFSPKVWKTVLYAGVIILVLNFILKNYYLLFRGQDVLSALDQAADLFGRHH